MPLKFLHKLTTENVHLIHIRNVCILHTNIHSSELEQIRPFLVMFIKLLCTYTTGMCLMTNNETCSSILYTQFMIASSTNYKCLIFIKEMMKE